jgi:Fungal chitosanase of glycosyl hydrolase group 75
MAQSGSSGNTFWMSYRGVNLYQVAGSTAYFYSTTNVAIDADGAPNAYNPQDTGLDYLANAGYPNGDWPSVLAPDPLNHHTPYVQKAGQPFPGYFVAKTSLYDHSNHTETDPARYLDARTVPYMIFPGAFALMAGTGRLGDFVMARVNGLTSAAVVGDVGPQNAPLGEISIGLAVNLGGHNPSPKDGSGAPQGTFEYVVFPGSRATPPWPLSPAPIRAKATALLAQIGGWPSAPAAPSA